jgi:hypothetical protein
MSLFALLILLLAGGFLLAAAMRLRNSKNVNPLAQLELHGVLVQAQVVGLEPHPLAPNVDVEYGVDDGASTILRRTLPWPAHVPLPELGSAVRVRYLPEHPGLSRLWL